MSITLTASFSRKLGQPNYSSVGASCQIQCELDSTLLAHDLDEFHRRVRSTYTACVRAVDDELARHLQNQDSASQQQEPLPELAPAPNEPGGNPTAQTNGADRPAANLRNGRRGRRATSAQLRAIDRLTARSGVELPPLLQEDFAVTTPDQLSVAEAAQLIVYLQESLPRPAATA
jgi:hypothetical protein